MKRKNRRKLWLPFISVIACLALLAGCGTSANETNNGANAGGKENGNLDNYPAEKIDFLVGFSPGGGTDTTSRKITQLLSGEKLVEQTFVVNNMPGAMGGMALMEQKKRQGDMYTIQGVSGFMTPLWTEGLGATLSDVQPIASLTNTEILIVVPKNSPYNTVTELLDATKEKNITVGIVGPQDGEDAFTWNKIRTAYDMNDLNYVSTDGISESLSLVLGDKVDATLLLPIVAKDYIETGDLKALAVLSDKHSEFLPDVPTLQEEGIDVISKRYYGVVASAGVSQEIIDYWSSKFEEMIELDGWKTYLEDSGLISEFHKSEEYIQYLETEGKEYQEYLQSLQ
ncbi:tripartite tricarboxylate transporter substrate binding protein [Sporosarcina sp. FSL W7-1349]|uniref:tripartite tricarboxylate transporter substrate binding protein n=1 Tax=Sporosarcina sp. FSL W7-1349 TaxID=2921561 RepID=UPI0030F8C5A6